MCGNSVRRFDTSLIFVASLASPPFAPRHCFRGARANPTLSKTTMDDDPPTSPHAASAPRPIPAALSRASAAAAASTPLAAALDAHEGVPADWAGARLGALTIAPASRDLEPGGWVDGDVRETPPAPSAFFRSSRFGEALEEEEAAKSAAVAVADATTVSDGLAGGEAAWWASSSGSIYPAFIEADDSAADEDALWADVRASAADVAAEPLLAAHVAATIGAADNIADALAAVLAARLDPGPAAEPGSQPSLPRRRDVAAALAATAAADVAAAHWRRPPPRPTLAETLLFHDGLHALCAQRVAAASWRAGATFSALALQARVSEVLGADLHPAARVSAGVVIVHPLGVVIGEAAVVGPACVICAGVTLGGTGKERGADRHPKLGANVQVGVNATIIGPIHIGDGARIAAAALVLKPVPPGGLAAGSPARVVGLKDELGWDL